VASAGRHAARLGWPAILVGSTLLAAIAVAAPVSPGIRLPIVLWFLAVCPGLAIVRLARLEDGLGELVTGVALSFALIAALAIASVYAQIWQPYVIFGILAAIALAAVAVDVVRARSQ